MNNLYFIIDKNGKKVKFQLNWAQKIMFEEMHTRNLVLKARQLGSTTFWSIYFLDLCLFHKNQNCGIISYNLESAHHIFKRIIRRCLENIDPLYRPVIPHITSDSARELAFSNGSSIRCDTSMRGATLSALLVTEFGRTCARYPAKAREVIAGSINTLATSSLLTIESTMEGSSGAFYQMCSDALARKEIESPLQMKFFFFPWWKAPEYRLDHLPPEGSYPQKLLDYFDMLHEEHGIDLDVNQEAWYLHTWNNLSDEVIKQEFPSTPQEAFEVNSEQYFFRRYLLDAEMEERITRVPYQQSRPVYVSFDIGISDACSLWFYQLTPGGAIRFIDFYENDSEPLPHYVNVIRQKDYMIEKVFLPHDAAAREKASGESFATSAKKLGLPVQVLPQESVLYGINRARLMLRESVFDKRKCEVGIDHLMQYRKKWNERMNAYSSEPLHDEHSHCADSLRYAMQSIKMAPEDNPREKELAKRLMELERRNRF